MSYLTSNLVPGERVIYQTRLHWIVMLGNLAVGCLALVLPGAALLYYLSTHDGMELTTQRVLQGVGLALIVAGLIAIVSGMLKRNATEMAVTNRRVVIKTGLSSRKTIEMLLNKVESIEVHETTLGRVLGYGAIVVVGTGGSTEPFQKIAHPLVFRSQLQQQIETPLPTSLSVPPVKGSVNPVGGAAVLDSAAR